MLQHQLCPSAWWTDRRGTPGATATLLTPPHRAFPYPPVAEYTTHESFLIAGATQTDALCVAVALERRDSGLMPEGVTSAGSRAEATTNCVLSAQGKDCVEPEQAIEQVEAWQDDLAVILAPFQLAKCHVMIRQQPWN